LEELMLNGMKLAIATSLMGLLLPTYAGAVTLTDDEGTILAGSRVVLTSDDLVFNINGVIRFECAETLLEGELTGEGEEIVETSASGSAFECEVVPLGAPLGITSISGVFNFNSNLLTMVAVYDGLGATNCTLEGTVAANWEDTTDTIDFAGGPMLGTGSGCPAGAQSIAGTFTATTDGIDPIIVHN
jgi:hypothetical protein